MNEQNAPPQPYSPDAPPPPPPPPPSGGNNTVAVVIIILAVVGLLGVCVCGGVAAILFPAIKTARSAAYQAASASNVRQIGFAMMTYAADHNGAMPVHVGQLVSGGYTDDTVFMDPSVSETPPNYLGGPPPADHYTFGDCHFVYKGLGGGSMNGVASDDIILFGRLMETGRRNILFGDGHVESVPEAEFTLKVRAANAKRAAAGLTPIDPNGLGDYTP